MQFVNWMYLLNKYTKYRICQGLGYGKTTIAKDINAKEKTIVVLKKVKHISESDKQHNFIEVGALSSCNHPNIVKFYDAESKKLSADMWIVMEYLQGGTLQEAYRGCRLTERHMAFFAREILKGLNYLHKRNLVHRDLKCSNVMIDMHGNVKLIDFGLVADVSYGPRSGCVGTPHWIAPEMVKQELHSCPVDLWSLGVCMLELLLGHPPYYPSTIKCMLKTSTVGLAHLIPNTTSDNAHHFISKCLTIDQTTRPTAKQLLQFDWVSEENVKGGILDALGSIFLSKQLQSIVF